MQERPLDVLCVGFACLDLTIPFAGLPRYDRKTEFDDLLIEGGGPASTAAVALHRLGCEVGLISVVGGDDWGGYALRRLGDEGVDATSVARAAASRTPLALILADPAGGARTILWNRGTLPPLDAAAVRRHWKPARLVLVDEVYPEASVEAMRLAREAGIPVLFDAGTAGPGLDELVEGVDHLIPAERFCSRLTGIEDPQAALREVQRRNGRPVIVTRGAQGCWLDDGHELSEFPAMPVRAIDSTGAGDAFHAAYGFGLLQGWPIERRIAFAGYYAGQSCTALGGRAGLLRREQVEEWLRDPHFHRNPELEET